MVFELTITNVVRAVLYPPWRANLLRPKSPLPATLVGPNAMSDIPEKVGSLALR